MSTSTLVLDCPVTFLNLNTCFDIFFAYLEEDFQMDTVAP